MSVVNLTLWLGTAAIYLAFAAAFGLVLRRLRLQGRGLDRWLAWLHGGLILLPATILVLGYQGWPPLFSLLLVSAGGLISFISAVQPSWTPIQWWRPRFSLRYIAVSMALAAVWAAALAWQRPSLGLALLALAALAAGLASLAKAPQQL